jgi:transcriptional regulator with XRE-family HTH domain
MAARLISAAQSRMARAALNWGVREVALAAGVSTNTITRLERGEELLPRTVDAIRAALESAGIIFLAEGQSVDGGPGVRLAKR